MREHSLELIEPLRLRDLIRRFVARGGSELGEYFCDIDGYRLPRTPHGVLVDHMTRDSKQILFGAANALVAFSPQQAKENLLCQVRNVRGVTQPHRQKAAQPGPIPRG